MPHLLGNILQSFQHHSQEINAIVQLWRIEMLKPKHNVYVLYIYTAL